MAVDVPGTEPTGDDQPMWREQLRFDRDVTNELAALRSMIEQLQGRVN